MNKISERLKVIIMKQSRWKSKVLWAAILAQLVVLLQVAGVWEMIGINESTASNLFAAILQILAIFGIINDPTNADSL
jgi:phi LC3 family holin